QKAYRSEDLADLRSTAPTAANHHPDKSPCRSESFSHTSNRSFHAHLHRHSLTGKDSRRSQWVVHDKLKHAHIYVEAGSFRQSTIKQAANASNHARHATILKAPEFEFPVSFRSP